MQTFEEENLDLLFLDRKEIATPTAAEVLCGALGINKLQFEDFVRERLLERTKRTD